MTCLSHREMEPQRSRRPPKLVSVSAYPTALLWEAPGAVAPASDLILLPRVLPQVTLLLSPTIVLSTHPRRSDILEDPSFGALACPACVSILHTAAR